MNARVVMALVVALVLALGAVILAARGRDDDGRDAAALSPTSKFAGAVMPPGIRAPDFRLRNQDGDPVTMREFRGRPVVVTFLYTTCDESCPGMAQTVRGALDRLGHDVPALAIAVDPPRDTPERARAFLAKQRALGRIHFVLGTREELRPLWKGFAIQPQTITQEHQARFTLVDKRGLQRIGFPGSRATPDALAHDLRLLERE